LKVGPLAGYPYFRGHKLIAMLELMGIFLFFFIFGLAFWMLIFLFGVLVPTWLIFGTLEWVNPSLAARLIDGKKKKEGN